MISSQLVFYMIEREDESIFSPVSKLTKKSFQWDFSEEKSWDLLKQFYFWCMLKPIGKKKKSQRNLVSIQGHLGYEPSALPTELSR